MLIEPIEIELDVKRKVFFSPLAIMRAEKKINQWREVPAKDFVRIDYMILQSAKDTGGLPRDLLATLLWAGLLEVDPNLTFPGFDEEKKPIKLPLTVEMTVGLVRSSPLTEGQITTLVWDHYLESTKKPAKLGASQANGAVHVTGDPPGDDPLAQRPGSTSGALQ